VAHTLLLADDSVTIQRVIELTFADEDITVVAVSDGDQAIERIDAEPPDIVLADVGMPGRTGYDVARHIKESPRLSHIPVLLLTGAFEPVDQNMAAEAGCDGVLAKPFEPQLVIARVKELLGGNGAGRAPSESEATRDPAPAPAPAASNTPVAGQLDNYFDRLDQAFAEITGSGPVAPAADLPLSIDTPSEPAAPLDLNRSPVAVAEPPIVSEPPVAVEPSVAAAPPAVAAPRSAAPLPSLADAFAVILASEQPAGSAAAAPVWPSPPPPALSDAAVQDIVARVLARLSETVTRETVADIVAKTAERLVREEIERIKTEARNK